MGYSKAYMNLNSQSGGNKVFWGSIGFRCCSHEQQLIRTMIMHCSKGDEATVLAPASILFLLSIIVLFSNLSSLRGAFGTSPVTFSSLVMALVMHLFMFLLASAVTSYITPLLKSLHHIFRQQLTLRAATLNFFKDLFIQHLLKIPETHPTARPRFVVSFQHAKGSSS